MYILVNLNRNFSDILFFFSILICFHIIFAKYFSKCFL